MNSRLLQHEHDLPALRRLIERADGEVTLTELEESMQISGVRRRTRLWQEGDRLTGFAWVDDYNNLRFGMEPGCASPEMEDEMVEWGVACMREKSAGLDATLDACSESGDVAQIAMLERHGFRRAEVRTLRYARPLLEPIVEQPLPGGFSLRFARGEEEVEVLVELHRAAFGTQNMTVEVRLAIMRTAGYARELDLLAVAPDGELAAFCICSLESPETGWTDPLGVRPRYQRLGLGGAIVSAGLAALQARGAREARLGTSSENLPMQRLAESLGFTVISEKLWFSKLISPLVKS